MNLAFERTFLPNGLCVLAHRDSSLRTARVFLGYKVGSCHERQGVTGIAHLLEHLMFEGTPRFPHFDILIQKAGGASNAFTSQDFTCYYESLPDENLEVALALEADRMLNAALTDEKIEIQKKVVLEEFKERYINNPYGDVWHLLRSLCFPDHPYEWPVIGRSLDEVAGLTPEMIRSFHTFHYQPDQAVLVIVSPRPEEEVIELACRLFDRIKPRGSGEKKKNSWPSVSDSLDKIQLRRKTVVRNVPDPVLYICWRMPSIDLLINPKARLLAELLGGSESSYLYTRFVREKPLFTALQTYHLEGKLGGLFVMSGRLKAHVSFSEAEENILKALEELAMGSLEIGRLQRVKNMYRTAKAFELVQPSERAQRLLWFQLMHGDAALESRDDEMLESTKIEDLCDILNFYLDPKLSFVLEYESTIRQGQYNPELQTEGLREGK